MASAFTVVRDVSVGGWIAPRLGPFGPWVGSVAPRGFPAYARVLHAVERNVERLRWSEVAERTGRVVHPTVQWHALVGQRLWEADYTKWPFSSPSTGEIDAVSQQALVGVLRGFSPPGEDWYLGVWEGVGWLDRDEPPPVALRATWVGLYPEPAPAPEPPFGPGVLNGPLLRHPQRNYLILSGPPSAVLELGYWTRPDRFVREGRT